MNSTLHAKISCRAAGTEHEEDFNFFNKVHDFMDCSKEVEASNLHRGLTHSLHFVKRVMIPIFGFTYKCVGNGREVNLKDDLEKNHLLADNGGKFIASLTDYVNLIKDDSSDEQLFNEFQLEHSEFFDNNPTIKEFMLSPLANTGMLKSLHISHNSWVIGHILPKVFPKMVGEIKIKDYSNYSPSIMFNRMRFESWCQNGQGSPPSFAKISEYRKRKKD